MQAKLQQQSSTNAVNSYIIKSCLWWRQGWVSKRRKKHSALAVVRRSQKFSSHHRPLPGGTGRPKF